MPKLIRRDAIRTLVGGTTTAFLGLGSSAHADSHHPDSAIVQGTLTMENLHGRKMTGFLETGITNGHVLCTLVKQDPANPPVLSVFASPQQLAGMRGTEVTIVFFSEPTGDVTVNVLHVGDAVTPLARKATPMPA